MGRKFFALGVVLLSVFFFVPGACVWASLSWEAPAELRRVTVYQGVNLAWVEELFVVHLRAGENRLSLSRDAVEKGRIVIHPLQGELQVKRLEEREGRYELVLSAKDEGSYRLVFGFFVRGLNWKESYLGVLGEEGGHGSLTYKVTDYPPVFNRNKVTDWRGINWSGIGRFPNVSVSGWGNGVVYHYEGMADVPTRAGNPKDWRKWGTIWCP
ncbi:MAG: hypothetical protein ACUVTO_03825 [Candidatus Caldatribacteriaceae bacterium]